MKNIYFIILTIVLGLTIFTSSCAKRGTITGGLKDTIAPKIISSSPKNFNTNFQGNEIKITFNELIKVKNINKQLIISPPFKKQPIIIPQGSASKFISIKILDTLKPNTTYSFNFGQSITDNNEGNPYSQFKYVFSTGTYIDSLALLGKIKDAYEEKPDNFISVQLYDATTFKDSTVFNETPLYVTNTLDSLKVFAFENLKAGEYKIIALKDKNNNYKYDPKTDKIAFLEQTITLPNDTVYELELFKEKGNFKADKPIQQTNNKFYMGFQGDPKQTKVTAKIGEETIPLKMTRFPDKGKDSVQLFFPIVKPDSLVVSVENGDYSKSFKTKIKELKETDSLEIQSSQRNLNFRDNFTLKTKTPINSIEKSKIKLINKDSVAVDFDFIYKEFEQEIVFDFKKEESQKYTMEILPEAIEDFYNTKNDSLLFSFTTKALSDYGNLKIMVKNANRYPYIVEILTDKGNVIASESRKNDQPIFFDSIEPRIYTLRIIYDDNQNGIWDTGNFLEKKQAEQIIYYSKKIDVRANWDVEQEFQIGE
ncbi:Ig-like domain-containing protein [Flavobacterium jejuense]|uniref:Ig-like domain-containing protein n=1 Tax=Flavobacterium jejuense TaxID=1544455 RepID=A0ABX0IVX3_9FLAO|nr:Ig-like domain-containing protein [Flavobacterium jejuense]NHN27340.1 Ig-like domain-containing protein [Flavobacterium jejuense]